MPGELAVVDERTRLRGLTLLELLEILRAPGNGTQAGLVVDELEARLAGTL